LKSKETTAQLRLLDINSR